MYTQCSKCETVFELSADVLRTAGGQVRCGNCGEVFNALARLAEDSSAFVTGETSLDMEERADSILESSAALPVAESVETEKDGEEGGPPGAEIARLEVFDWPEDESFELDADRSMEFTLPPGELDRIFVESKKPGSPKKAAVPPPSVTPPSVAPPSVAPPLTAPPLTAPPLTAPPAAPPAPKPAPKPAAQPASPAAKPASPVAKPASPVTTPQPPAAKPQSPAAAPEPELPPHPESVAVESAARHPVGGFEISEEVRRDMLEGFEQRIFQPTRELRKPARTGAWSRPFVLWLGAAIVSALLLMAQLVHRNREWFVPVHGPLGAMVRALYGAMGSPLPLPSNLSAYQLRQWGVTGNPEAGGKLRLRASILNAAPQLQPYPLLRVTLADRFGKSIGSRDFEPSEYMGKPTARLLAPGERADATLEILDPGKNAEGFEIDVCLRGVDQRVSCASDAAPQAKR